MSDHIQSIRHERVLELHIHRPEKKNALTTGMYDTLTSALIEGENDEDIRVIMFTGEPELFTAGNDMSDFLNNPPDGEDSPVFRFLSALIRAKKPLIAAVDGIAIGIGTTLLMHCELVYASERARFQLPFARLGLCPEAASSLLLPRLAGYQHAAEMLLLGEAFGATRGQEIGLVNAVVHPDKLFEHAMEKAQTLASMGPDAVRTSKAMLKRWQLEETATAVSEEGDEFIRLLKGPEANEALQAFMQKRAPDFSKF